MSSSSFNDAFIHTARYFTWSKNCTRTPFTKTSDGAGCLYFFGQIRTPIVLLQLKVISCSAAFSKSCSHNDKADRKKVLIVSITAVKA